MPKETWSDSRSWAGTFDPKEVVDTAGAAPEPQLEDGCALKLY